MQSMFPAASYQELEPLVEPDIVQFKMSTLDKLDWLSMGKLIIDMYEHFKGMEVSGITYEFDFEQLFLDKMESKCKLIDVEMNENVCNETRAPEMVVDTENDGSNNAVAEEKQENSDSNSNRVLLSMPLLDGQGTNSADASADDSDANAKDASGSETTSKPKQSRRRGSDLQLLERWSYWEKNRKYSQRQKNKQNGRSEVDTSINGVLRKILERHFE